MAAKDFTAKEISDIDKIVKSYIGRQSFIGSMLDQLHSCVTSSSGLMRYVHSLRWRLKDPEHLRDKLKRKLKKSKESGVPFDLTVENFPEKINDLAGFRILHLHTSQIVDIDRELSNLFEEFKYEVVERATARTWDDEYRKYYQSAGIETVESPKMYTSVHYVVSPSLKTKLTCEIQVRTLAEELWGEVDHSMNYPEESSIETCRDQIKVLARVTSSCSRLVDSIYSASKVQEIVAPSSKVKKVPKSKKEIAATK
jgi:ppGpp synthetase/RelA/SpoT-type nucleotidyltranferase